MNPLCLFPVRALALHLALAGVLGAAVGIAQAKPSQNDTGMALCLVKGAFTKECAGTGQDGEFGRDVTKKNKEDGSKGFAYVKVCNSGELAGTGACPADPELGGGANKWGCTKDKVTKLIWEVKVKNGGLRDWLKDYTNWGDGRAGDASEFVAQVNAQGLCGASDWTLPTAEQLLGLVHMGVADPGPTIDKAWFPNTRAGNAGVGYPDYWTADGYATFASDAWFVDFQIGYVYRNNREYGYAVRLVRVGQ